MWILNQYRVFKNSAMKKEKKFEIVNQLVDIISKRNNFFITDVSGLNVKQTVELRKLCYKNGIELLVSKNTLIVKALEKLNLNNQELIASLKGPSSLMFCENPTAPAKVIKEFRKNTSKPDIKAAYIEDSIYVGDNLVDTLIAIKSKNELIGELVGMLNSPIRNLISALNRKGQDILGILETLSKK